MLAPGTIVGDRYVIEALLGEGASGAVHRAFRKKDKVRVALKLLHSGALNSPEMRKRFHREAAALMAAAHPNVLAVHELGEDEHGLFLVTELIAGRPLDAILADYRLDPEQAHWFADQILAGLGHAHGLGILHRDVKPDNVMVETSSWSAKILDFGLAKFHDREFWGEQTQITAEGAILGSPAYMSPEQIFGPGVDARSDVYSMGVVLFELLTGSWPFVRDENAAMFRAHLIDEPPTLGATRPDIAFRPELEKVVKKALAKKPDDRFPDARAMRDALNRVPRPIGKPKR